MTLEELNKKYVYKYDYKWFDTWTGLDDNFEGDCEDYCITLKKSIKGFEGWRYCYCKLDGQGHCILSDGINMIDCNVREVSPLGWYLSKNNVTEFREFKWFEVAVKLLLAKLYKVIKRI